ncbi:hypothetical protein VITU102760_13075 [Vibrio tubiashii]|uniref:Lipoprotein n=1 Tax=Vibrio tubiashii ATCC 19109 TaxID=1051646 RepID=F9TA77_9VIBR|nr:hypothetical protein [Vibrio tubiashii]AIW16121.1 hypothetical protein IX91_18650 [Vibrio tubiashii ATCC 19109]EGU50348.1 hypothetical protein VITU9109_23910 [Vibrio tubiashii ATCC 19109]EIF03542.1 hypothetical protein VT1337_12792 [Vibrio tubiashii NCIMB 1337 = ATCC 19106]
MKKVLSLFLLTSLFGCSTTHYEENNKTVELDRKYFIGEWSCAPKYKDDFALFTDIQIYRNYQENGVLQITAQLTMPYEQLDSPLTVTAKSEGVWMRDPFITDLTEFHHKFAVETNKETFRKKLTRLLENESTLEEMINITVEPHSSNSMTLRLPGTHLKCDKTIPSALVHKETT